MKLSPAMSKSSVPGIRRTPGVCGGDPCIRRTRIPVWLLVDIRQLGGSDEDILDDYPTLSQEDLDNAWAYYELHQTDIDQQIASQEFLEDEDGNEREIHLQDPYIDENA